MTIPNQRNGSSRIYHGFTAIYAFGASNCGKNAERASHVAGSSRDGPMSWPQDNEGDVKC